MNLNIETLNRWGENFLNFAGPMLWQSSLLIIVIFVLDYVLARRVRAAVRHALWIVVLIKLVLPPTLALPTSATWCLWPAKPALTPVLKNFSVSYDDVAPMNLPPSVPLPKLPPPQLSCWSLAMLASGAVSVTLLFWLAFHWLIIAGKTRRAASSGDYEHALAEAQQLAGLRGKIRLRLVNDAISPAVCGLFRPVILLPRALAETLSKQQLRAVLLHEAIHLRRGDVWMNCAQTLLQIAYWWHPLLWLANARMRRLREEAVDDAVMSALCDGADAYAPTLLEVAKFAFRRPLASLGLVGILESRSALRQRIERLVDFRPPPRTGLTFLPWCAIFAFSAVALPMGQAPAADDSMPPQTTNASPISIIATNYLANEPQAAGLLEAGKQAYDAGRFDEADLELSNALVLQPGNPAAHYYRDLISKTREAGPSIRTPDHSKRDLISSELLNIQLDKFGPYQDAPLLDVIQALNRRALDAGADFKIALNFIVPGTNQIMVSLPPMKNVSLDAIFAVITEQSSQPVIFSIMDDTVVFKTADNGLSGLETRTFKVMRGFYSGLEEASHIKLTPDLSGHNGGQNPGVAMAARNFFESLGANFDPPKTIFFNDGLGILFVYATPQDLDIVERGMQVLNDEPSQLHIKARFIEMPSTTNPNLVSGTGIITETEFQTTLHQLLSQKGVEEVAAPECTTLTGRQVRMMAGQTDPVITNYTIVMPPQAKVPTVTPQIGRVQCGSMFDVVPLVMADGYTVSLTATGERTQFFGYAAPKGIKGVMTNYNGEKITLPVALPAIQVSSASASALLYDGQTLVLFPKPDRLLYCAPDKKIQKLVADHISQAEKQYGDKTLVVLVTVTLVDRAGNRVHSDDDMPFAQKGVPPQPQVLPDNRDNMNIVNFPGEPPHTQAVP
jgi:beta-lactamase regulating signal transducer with metallopeptidase domain